MSVEMEVFANIFFLINNFLVMNKINRCLELHCRATLTLWTVSPGWQRYR